MSLASKTTGMRHIIRAKQGAPWVQLVLCASMLVGLAIVASCKPAPAPMSAPKPLPRPKVGANATPPSPYPADFQAWLVANPDQVPQFEALKAYLTHEGVADVLPLWQLVQTETQETATKCEIAGYAVPPRAMWPTIVPTLRLVREQIVPLLGPVKVLSSFRTAEANRCSLGAPESPHKRYSALDLAMVDPMPQKEMFAKLCKHWYGLSPSWGYGLGAYYVRGYPAYNQEGRFHVDTLGRRTWGYSYGAYTSHCRELGYIKVKSPEQIKAEEEAKLKAEVDALAKTEADAKAKVEADAKAKLDAEIKAKTQALEKAKLAEKAKKKADDDAQVKAVKGSEFEVRVMTPKNSSQQTETAPQPKS
jgi:Peptidase M15